VGVSRDGPNFLVPPIISGTRKATNFKFLQVYSQGPSEQKPLENLGETNAWAYPGTFQIFQVPPVISGTGKAANFKFGRYIHRVYPNKSPFKIWEKRERGPIQGLPNFFKVPPTIGTVSQDPNG